MTLYHWLRTSHVSKEHTAFTAMGSVKSVTQCHIPTSGVCSRLNVSCKGMWGTIQHFLCNKQIHPLYILLLYICKNCGLGSSVGIATNCGLDGPWIESRWGEIFRQSRPALGPTQPPVEWVPYLSRG
jgi:hypothetical protein